MNLAGKVSIVTGGAQGIGKSIALTLAKHGAAVAVVDVNLEAATQTAEEIRGLGVASLAQRVDVVDHAAVAVAVKEVVEKLGRVDILVNNAGITRDALLLRMKPEDFDLVLAINLKGTFNYTSGVLGTMVKQRSGRIVNVASVMGLIGNPGQANYSASKAGVIGLTRTAAKEVASRGITVNAVAPGFIETAMTQKLPEAVRAEILKRVPLGVVGQPDDVANGVLFLASDLARYITGHVLVIDGGLIE
jgi:3-oxoacyl-[acyl-carrier protein] reductase